LVKVKPIDQIQRNYAGSASTAAARYRDAAPGVIWQGPAVEGQALFEEKMRDPAVLARRSKNIQKVSDAEFRTALSEKGAPILASRMSSAAGDQAAGYAPYRTALEAVNLPKRTADPMSNIDNRLKPIVSALVAKKAEVG